MPTRYRSRWHLLAPALALATTGCLGVPQPAGEAPGSLGVVSARDRGPRLSARLENRGGLSGLVLGPAPGLLGNNGSGLVAGGAAGLLSDHGAGLISLTKYRLSQGAASAAVPGAQIEIQDAQGRRIAEPVLTDAHGGYAIPRVGVSGALVYVVARFEQEGHPVTLMRIAAAPRSPGLADARVDVATTLVAKKAATSLKQGVVAEDALRAESLEHLARELAPLMSPRAVAAVALLAEEQTALVFDTMLARVEVLSGERRAAIDRADAGGLIRPPGSQPAGSASPAHSPSEPLPNASIEPTSPLAGAPSPAGASQAASPTPGSGATSPATGDSLLPGSPVPPATSATTAPPPTSAPPRPLLGVYRGSSTSSVNTHLPSFETWLGRPAELALDYAAGDTWDNMRGPSWFLEPWKGWKDAKPGRRVLFSIGMLPGPSDGSGPTTGLGAGQAVSLESGASGAYDDHWRALSTSLVNRGLADATLSLGYDFNTGRTAWKAAGRAAAYAGYYRKVVSAMRSVPGAAFKFAWHPSLAGDWNAEEAWPGDDVVDVVALSAFDYSGSYPTSGAPTPEQLAAARAKRETGPRGLQFWLDYATQHGKGYGIGGWGLGATGASRGGGDNPAFIEAMHAWITEPTHRMTYQIYYDGGSGGTRDLSDGGPFPNAARRYKELFGP